MLQATVEVIVGTKTGTVQHLDPYLRRLSVLLSAAIHCYPHGQAEQTDEINVFVMQAYYTITNMEIDFTAPRDQLYREFVGKNPGTNAAAQRVSDQC
jgi:hypothetical protein